MSKKLLLSLTLLSLLATDNLTANDVIEDDLSGFDMGDDSEENGDLEGFGDDDTNEIGGFDDLDSSDELDGFSDNEVSDIALQEASTQSTEESIFSLSGNIAFKTSVGYREHQVKASPTDATGIEYSGINQAQISTYLQLDTKLSDDWKMRISGDAYYDAIYDINSNNNYNQDTLDAYKTQLRLDDTYVQGRITRDIDLKVGRQIVVWGKSDSIRITDVINPIDNRVPGMTDIEDLRLSVGMAKLDYYIGSWNLSAMAIVESRILLEAAPRGEFFPVDNIFPTAPNPFIELVTPDSSVENMQYAFAANGVFSGWDLSFYAADVLDQKWHIDTTVQKRVVTKVQMLGSAINIAAGSWLLKSEIAHLNGVKYNSTTDAKSRLDALVGVDYMGIKDTVLSLEIANRHIFDYEAQMSQLIGLPDYVHEDELQTAMRATRSFVNDTINATALVSMFGHNWQYGGFARVWVEYEVMNAVNANFGIVDYIDGDKPFTKAIKDNDRVFADITYSF
jgi:hypothetical protein